MLASLASHAFGLAVAGRNRAFDRGWFAASRLPARVISVGNLSVGGSGKTPAVIALGRELARRGIAYDVLTRGYRRAGRTPLVLTGPARGGDDVGAGDEPRLLARALGAPILVDADRARAGREGERRFHSELHLLDDGFQHRQLARDCDLVLVHPGDLEDRLLPAGRLREPPAALARAQAIVWLQPSPPRPGFPNEDAGEPARRCARWSSAPVFCAWKRPSAPPSLPRRPVAFCGLARPQSFWRTLDELGVAPVACRGFRDHHRYSDRDLRRLERLGRRLGADGLVTTAKDAMNLPPAAGGVAVVPIELVIDQIGRLVDLILA